MNFIYRVDESHQDFSHKPNHLEEKGETEILLSNRHSSCRGMRRDNPKGIVI